MPSKIRSIVVSFPEPIDLSNDDQIELDRIISGICDRYRKANPHRTMWAAGHGLMPLNIWTAGDDEALEFDESTYSIDCAERENYDWPCAKCGLPQGDHQGMILNPKAGACAYSPMPRA